MGLTVNGLYLIEILHQTTTFRSDYTFGYRCILSKFYIKPQLRHSCPFFFRVVSYRNSTSNHNQAMTITVAIQLYLIEILHQTTTSAQYLMRSCSCILSKFYIKPQHEGVRHQDGQSCILSKFYIKPQLSSKRRCTLCVVSYRNSTSNHNWKSFMVSIMLLYLIEILHQTTTQLRLNHSRRSLYLIEILHQTTTVRSIQIQNSLLYLIEILHQTTTMPSASGPSGSCILSKFYIKPQPRLRQ